MTIHHGLILYSDRKQASVEAFKLLKNSGLKFRVKYSHSPNLPIIKNGDICYQGLEGIKNFIWMRTPIKTN